MCVVSMIGDHYREKLDQWIQPLQPITYTIGNGISREEFDDLKREVENLRDLLVKAKLYDEEHDEPDCHVEEKLELLRQLANELGVELPV